MIYAIPTTMKASRQNGISETSYDVLSYEDVPVPSISDDEILVKNKFAGVNFIEKLFRTGKFPSDLPRTNGEEAAGVVVQVGKSVSGYKVGDIVVYLGPATFAQYTKVTASGTMVLVLPPGTDDEMLKQHCAAFAQGLTALALTTEAYDVKKGDYVLVHAAAGGVGLCLTQTIARAGAHVIATASTTEKLEVAKTHGAEFVINSKTDDIVAKVKEYTNGAGVEAVFDAIGKDTFEISLSSLARKGTFVSYGESSGPAPLFGLNRLAEKNLKVLYPSLYGYIVTKEEWTHLSNEFLKLVSNGELKQEIYQVYPLAEYKHAAEDLESRRSTGKLLLEIPQ